VILSVFVYIIELIEQLAKILQHPQVACQCLKDENMIFILHFEHIIGDLRPFINSYKACFPFFSFG
jgi:hypothetical protein